MSGVSFASSKSFRFIDLFSFLSYFFAVAAVIGKKQKAVGKRDAMMRGMEEWRGKRRKG